jgi:Domain of unknown function (DUF6268)
MKVALGCSLLFATAALAFAGPSPLPTDDVTAGGSEGTDDSSSKFPSISGEYLVESTYVGEAGVRSGHRIVSDFDENDTILRGILTPRVKLGVLRLGAEYERFSFGFPSKTPIPNTLQSVALVLGIDTQLSDSILLRFEAQPGLYSTNNIGIEDFNVPFIAGGTYIYNPNLQFVVGVSVDIDRKYPVIPGAGIRWKIARQWLINAVMPDPRIEFEASKSLTLYGGATIKETSFRVGDEFGNTHGSKMSRLNNAVLTYNEVRTGVGCDWKVASFLTLSAEAGYQPYRNFDYYRTDLRFHEDGSAPYGMVSLHGAF